MSTQKKVKTRKPHRCWGCWKVFPEGSAMTVTTVFTAESVNTSYTCEQCEDWLLSNTDDWDLADWESLMPGNIGYWKNGQWFAMITN